MSLDGRERGAALGRDRGGDARPHALAIAPLNAPRTQRWGVGCGVCQWVCWLAGPMSCLACRLVVPWPPPLRRWGRGPHGSEGVAAARRGWDVRANAGANPAHSATEAGGALRGKNAGGGNHRTVLSPFRFSCPGSGFSPLGEVKPLLRGELETWARNIIYFCIIYLFNENPRF